MSEPALPPLNCALAVGFPSFPVEFLPPVTWSLQLSSCLLSCCVYVCVCAQGRSGGIFLDNDLLSLDSALQPIEGGLGAAPFS